VLTHLAVRDLAIVDNLGVDLGPGMTVLTGETGAGKSLLVDALELAVGGRASAELVRAGAAAAEVTAVFEPDAPASAWLREHALDEEDGACVLRRVTGADGRSRAFVNGRPVPVSQLRALGERLVDVHGQHAHQALLHPRAQRELLDSFLSAAGARARTELADVHRRLLALDRTIAGLAGGDDPRARADFLRFQIEELRAAPIAPQSLVALGTEHRRQAHAAEILDAVARARAALGDEEGSAETALGTAIRAIESASRLDDGLAEPLDGLQQCAALLAEADAALRRYADGLEADPQRLQELEQTLATVHALARKHRVAEDALGERLAALEQELATLECGTARREQAERERRALAARYAELAALLNEQRRQAARRLASAVNGVLASLGMEGARIAFAIEHHAGATPAHHGLDQVRLEASTNPGQAPLPLARIASGGELSRIALAIHGVALDRGGAATLVFDEVDAGVGGAVAEIVGRRMRELGTWRQVLTVTHLPQVAALAHAHVAVHKERGRRASHSRVQVLGPQQRERELARMLGGLEVTARTLEHAREMLRAGALYSSTR